MFTPAIETGILPGMTRAFILESGEKAGIAVNEGLLWKRDVEQADELFVTNAVQELVPLSAVGESVAAGCFRGLLSKITSTICAGDRWNERRVTVMELSKAKEIYRFGNTELDFKKETVIMGILNVTPDSFSDGGKYGQIDAALKRAEEMLRDGAKIIDIGGESTRPGHDPVSLDEGA